MHESACAEVWRGSNESNHNQTTLSDDCSDCTLVRSECIEQLAWSDLGSTHWNFSEFLHSLSSREHLIVVRQIRNLSAQVLSLLKQQFAWFDCGSTHSEKFEQPEQAVSMV